MFPFLRRKQPLAAFFQTTSERLIAQADNFYRASVCEAAEIWHSDANPYPSDAQEVACFYETVIWEILIFEQALFTFPDLDHRFIRDQLCAHAWHLLLGTDEAEAEERALRLLTGERLSQYYDCRALAPLKDDEPWRGTMAHAGAVNLMRALGSEDEHSIRVMMLMTHLASHFASTRKARVYEAASKVTDLRLVTRV